ncbi:uncharacterized protein [Amphiura filiformis]|uniref:uncharacterized protein n=1 Tax=Amphiura filiformis TaxID=82378 RepID=UPI003B226E01
MYSSNTEMNPGPSTGSSCDSISSNSRSNSSNTKWHCLVCNEPCVWDEPALGCDKCAAMYHRRCMGITSSVYHDIVSAGASWTCIGCETPNYSLHLFDTFTIETNNSFESLDPVSSEPLQSPLGSDIGLPKFASSPIQHSTKVKTTSNDSLRVLVINLQSANAKKEAFWNLVDSAHPDVIIGSYRPNNNDVDYILKLVQDIESIAKNYPSSTLWVAGDLNLPDIYWENYSIISYQYRKIINETFLETINNVGLEQLVDEPTRGTNILDLFLTNRPSFVSKCKVIPGVSDHEAVLVDSATRARRQRPVKRKIYLWNRAKLDKIREDVKEFSTDFVAHNDTSTPVEELWNLIDKKLCQVMEDCVPSKYSSQRFNQPWINSSVKKLSRRKKRAFRTAKRTKSPTDWQYYKELKKLDQAECRKRYHSYVNNMTSESFSSNSKKFWRYIKSKKCDNSGVAPLKRDGIAHSNSKTKAQILNQQFTSVFTCEDTDNLPDLGPSPYPELPDIQVHVCGVAKLLRDLNPHKTSGPDGITSRL